ncbi:MAG: hypothetical protein DSM106950_22355 [Stigonema ocellatum SAG 48.90 = DSM 106950]|nr:hypothetical protein [Stigonema ocellatum SAG 48.90 = DSM 106950]
MAAVILSALELNHPTCQEYLKNKLSFNHQLNGHKHVFEQESITALI